MCDGFHTTALPMSAGAVGQVAADGREVERRDGVDEPLERPVIHPVPRARRRVGLLAVDPLGVVHVEPEEVDQLAGAVDLRLERGLALAQHGGGVEPLPGRRGQQVRGLEEDRGAVLEPPVAPVALGLHRRPHRRVDGRAVGLVQGGQHPRMAVGRDDVMGDPAPDLAPADHGRNVRPLAPDRRRARP